MSIPACVSLGARGQQVTTIPFDQVTSRSPKIEQLLQEYSSAHQSKTAIANNNNQEQQNNDNSSLLLPQLQQELRQKNQELEKERQRANSLEAQLQKQKKFYKGSRNYQINLLKLTIILSSLLERNQVSD